MKKIALFLFPILILISCESSDDSSDTDLGVDNSFNRAALLTNMADNLIIPAYDGLNADLLTLKNDKDAFVAAPDQVTLNNLRESWLAAYLSWQYVEMYNIGMAQAINYRFEMNVYPTNVNDISNNISSGSYDLSIDANDDAVGFPAVEYLIYGTGSDAAGVINYFSTSNEAMARLQYLDDLIERMVSVTAMVRNDWIANYRNEFITSTDNTATSAVNMLINDFIFYYEKGLRANKIGIPAGLFSNTTRPDLVEGFYSKDHSKALALESLQAVQAFFNGAPYRSSQPAGTSYADYADARTVNTSGELSLSSRINNQWEVARAQLNSLDNNFENQVTTDNIQMTMAFDELQRNVVLLKVDLLQALNINVDFVDADGD